MKLVEINLDAIWMDRTKENIHKNPQIKLSEPYLVLYNDKFFAGHFINHPKHGYELHCGHMHIQYTRPANVFRGNYFQRIWRIVAEEG